MRKFLLLGILLLNAFAFIASEKPSERTCIVKVEVAISSLVKQYSSFIDSTRILSKSMGIHLLYLSKDYSAIKQTLLMDAKVLSVQGNYRSKRRFAPNDPLYSQQWQLPKIGMEEAWDLTTSGVNKLGDTIVIAVIDDGLDITNPDIAPNVWYNKGEIPNDGKDNDNNGFVDDYYGWNSKQHDDEIFDPIEKARHGTPVTGIIAAKGDNAMGVAGLNWQVKIMAIVGGILDADIIESYDYIIEQKKSYLQSNGAKGAYVVATNSSWGRDGKKEEDAPLWCAMYDSLGKYGILNIGAVSNSNQDLDVIGDLPTHCSSPYLVAVTDVDSKSEVKAGYGLINVDLGAPGSNSLTTASRVDTVGNGWYRSFGATSGATPYATGAVGVLYSHACQKFLELHTRRPDSAALLVREFMLTGVDSSAFMLNKVSSGGSLNVGKMLHLMNEWCKDPEIEQAVNVFPNPAMSTILLSFAKATYGELKVFNTLGEKVYEEEVNGKVVALAVGQWSSGIYYVEYRENNSEFYSFNKVLVL